MTAETKLLLDDKHIFLIEDNPANLAVIRTVLRQQGAIVSMVTWADTSLRDLAKYPFPIDCVVLDLMFEGKKSGYDVFDEIQQDRKLRHVPVVIVSAADPDVEIPKAMEKGMQGFISKPIGRHQLPKQIRAIINGETVWG